jgi:DNA invertase Pin-like site-specific DNA recombinase
MEEITGKQDRAVQYVRVASSYRQDNLAAERQRAGCRRVATHQDLTIVREYADLGRPARLDQQIELLRLLDDLHQKRDVGAVIVWDYARLARVSTTLKQILHHVQACGAEIIAVVEEGAEREGGQRRGGGVKVCKYRNYKTPTHMPRAPDLTRPAGGE